MPPAAVALPPAVRRVSVSVPTVGRTGEVIRSVCVLPGAPLILDGTVSVVTCGVVGVVGVVGVDVVRRSLPVYLKTSVFPCVLRS